MNDGSKEPQEKNAYSMSSFEKCGWFQSSVDVHIQNFENDSGGTYERGKTKTWKAK